MILEVAILNIRPTQEKDFECAFKKAQEIISRSNGYVSHQLKRCIEKGNRYILLVNWETLEDHTVGFKQSNDYKEWSKLLHHFYDPFPDVEHYSDQ
ncbi:MAG: antibiotic biosynthesis monooxygenase [Candidatus Sedimenticola sp. (ex Thyasira tokunagai)]